MTRLATAVFAVLLVAGAAPAVALSPKQDARVEGDWSTTIRPVELRPPGDYSTHYVSVSYKPKCAQGPCDVILTQPTHWGDVRQTLKRHGARYSGTKTFPGDVSCNNHDVRRGYRWRLTVVIRVVRVAEDGVSADRIRGRSTTRGTPRRKACAGGSEILERDTWRSKRVH
ncbi:MAG TPA: hypothetical protein VGF25_03850 [Thermoleophilaceae bacterium]|jgi:hypothetical protein